MTNKELKKINEELAAFEFNGDYVEVEDVIKYDFDADLDNDRMVPYWNEKELYTESLDSLVPVWEKIDIDNTDNYLGKSISGWCFDVVLSEGIFTANKCETIQEAAAIATHKAIQSIQRGEE
tara:strand:+ start:196 stop:561 length:366 start_codon:yes stop_codon:yes gene_type:complete